MAAATCAFHVDRSALALCMSCRRSLCQECATTWDGIHYCAACVAAVRQKAAPRGSRLATLATAVAVVALSWLVARLTAWSLVNSFAFWR
jgi:hypothetical protein